VNVRRKWFVQPALTSEFVNYYHGNRHHVLNGFIFNFMISLIPCYVSTFVMFFFIGFKYKAVLTDLKTTNGRYSFCCNLLEFPQLKMRMNNGIPDVYFPVSDRSARLKEMQERQEELQLNNKRLQQEEQHLREKYHEVHSKIFHYSENLY